MDKSMYITKCYRKCQEEEERRLQHEKEHISKVSKEAYSKTLNYPIPTYIQKIMDFENMSEEAARKIVKESNQGMGSKKKRKSKTMKKNKKLKKTKKRKSKKKREKK